MSDVYNDQASGREKLSREGPYLGSLSRHTLGPVNLPVFVRILPISISLRVQPTIITILSRGQNRPDISSFSAVLTHFVVLIGVGCEAEYGNFATAAAHRNS